jgi:CheY-like chemotaxis protein
MTQPKILLIDDTATDIQILRVALDEQAEEYQLEILSDGAAALHFVQEHRSGVRKPDPCVILLDLHLPKHNGLAVLKAIREAPAMVHIKVVVLTGVASPEELAEIHSLGALFRRKPMEMSEFMHLAREILALCKDAMSTAA